MASTALFRLVPVAAATITTIGSRTAGRSQSLDPSTSSSIKPEGYCHLLYLPILICTDRRGAPPSRLRVDLPSCSPRDTSIPLETLDCTDTDA
jgi:hypothetical protein